jgi:hypothetical protein
MKHIFMAIKNRINKNEEENITMKKNLKLEAPCYTYQKQVKALFERDPEIKVGDVILPEDGRADYLFDIEVRNHEKFLALDRVFPKCVQFGNITLAINLHDEENDAGADDVLALYETIFKGNSIVKDVRTAMDHMGTKHGFIRFQPEVIQFFDDDIYDYEGNWTGLAQDIAREVFANETRGIHFCTASVKEAKNPAGE